MKMSKNFISVTLLVVTLFSFIIAICLPNKAIAQETSANPVPVYTTSEIESQINPIENELALENTSVVQELYNQIGYYEDLLLTADVNDVHNIQQIIDTTNELITDYQSYKSSLRTRGVYHATLSPVIASVIAFFQLGGNKLSAELLTHAKNNDVLDSIYYPINGGIVEDSDIFKSIKDGNVFRGNRSFTIEDNTDLFYAIKEFRFSKSAGNTTIEIQDRYDYELDKVSIYSGITAFAVSKMAEAQQAGALVPFCPVITRNLPGVAKVPVMETIFIQADTRYVEKVTTLGIYEYQEYFFISATSRVVTIQTFGSKDAYLEIYNMSGVKLADNDDSGYSRNAFIKFDCSAAILYKIRVRFYNTDSGDIKLAIMPTYNYSSWEAFDTRTVSSYNLTTTNDSNKVWQLVFKPTLDKTYTITLTSNTNMYLYCIDPRATHLVQVTSGIFEQSYYNFTVQNNTQSIITKSLGKNVPYLIIMSKTNPSSSFTDGYTISIS